MWVMLFGNLREKGGGGARLLASVTPKFTSKRTNADRTICFTIRLGLV